jgi:serine protease
VDFGATATSATVICENRGQGAAVTASVTPAPAAPWLSVQTTETAAGNGLTNDTVTLTVDRTGLPTGVYQTRVTLVANVGAASTQVAFDVRMQVGASAGATDEVFVLLVDPLTLETYFQASALPGTGYLWNFGSIAAGQYLLVAGTDRDNDDEIGDDGEWFGAWPDLDAPAPIDAVAGSALTGLQFGLQDLVVVPGSAGAGAGAGASARRTFRRLL